MNTERPLIGREHLGFLRAAKAAFQFLEGYGFRIAREETTLLAYHGPLGSITIFHGRSSYEIGIELRSGNIDDDNFYHVGTLIALTDSEESVKYYHPAASTPESVQRFVNGQAQILRTYGQRIFSGDVTIWAELEKAQRERSREYWAEMNFKGVAEKADEAFRERRYDEVVRVLSEFESRLTSSQKKKLEYARTHSSGGLSK